MVTFKVLILHSLCNWSVSSQFHLLFQKCHWCPVPYRLLSALCRCSLTAPCSEPVLHAPFWPQGYPGVVVRFPWNCKVLRHVRSRNQAVKVNRVTLDHRGTMKNASPVLISRVANSEMYFASFLGGCCKIK